MFLKPVIRLHTLALLTVAGVLLLSACAAPMVTSTTAPTPEPQNGDTPVESPGEGTPSDAPQTPSWMPQAEDENLLRQDVSLDVAEVLTLESFPPQFMLHLAGTLPNPCAQLRVVVGDVDGQGILPVEVYALVDPAVLCAQTITDFEENVPLGEVPAGTYTVQVNGQDVAEITMPETGGEAIPPVEEDAQAAPETGEPEKPMVASGRVLLEDVELQRDSSTPAQYFLHLSGNLPTPCHKLKVDVQEPDDQNRLMVSVTSTVDPTILCTQVIQPFAEVVSLEGVGEGITVVVNGEEVGTTGE